MVSLGKDMFFLLRLGNDNEVEISCRGIAQDHDNITIMKSRAKEQSIT